MSDGVHRPCSPPPGSLRPPHWSDPLTLRLDGAPLAPDHGYPLRLIAPNRPGVLQTKWVTKVVVT